MDELEKGVQGYDKIETAGEIQVHSLSPGMVFTALLLEDSTPELRKFPFGVLAAQPEEVAADLVPKILETSTNGGSVEFLTTDRILTKFFERFILQKKSEYIDDDGNVIKMPVSTFSLWSLIACATSQMRQILLTLCRDVDTLIHRELSTTTWVSEPCTKFGCL